MAVSAQVVWDIIRLNDSFTVKSNGIRLSKDPKNLANVHNYKFSGVAQPKALGITATTSVVDKKSKVAITLHQTTTTVNKPKQATTSVKVSGRRKAGFAAVAKAVDEAYYRPDLRSAALARYSRLVKSTGVHAKATAVGGRKARQQ